MIEIKLVDNDVDLRRSHRVMVQLRPQLSQDAYVAQVHHQEAHDHYRVVSLYEDGEVRAVAGFRLATGLALGHHLYVDDLVTDSETRSHGHGKALLDWMEAHGKAHGCKQLVLDSGVQRHAAHRFYLRERMDIICYNFRKVIH